LLKAFRQICLALLCVLSIFAQEDSVSTQHAKVELIADVASIQPGQDLRLGVRYVLEPGWHVYWINPGDSGQPPSFKWQLPTGFQAGEIQWPRPQRLSGSQLVDYGYKDDVLFIVPVHTPANLNNDSPVAISADAKWLICREVCIPDRTRLRLSLPVSSSAPKSSADASWFTRAKAQLPKSAPKQWKTSVQSQKDDFVLTVSAGRPLRAAAFFPLDPGQIENAAPQNAVSTPNGVRITLKKSEVLSKPITTLRGLLEIAGREAYEIKAPVSSENAQK
jgi:DsbC/DsbD-like thiol-disulfide interchange protein